jgi:hypothetical protein
MFYFHKYDHHEFPGVVPRTFIGALIIAMISKPLQLIALFLGFDKLWCQVLGLILTLSVCPFQTVPFVLNYPHSHTQFVSQYGVS